MSLLKSAETAGAWIAYEAVKWGYNNVFNDISRQQLAKRASAEFVKVSMERPASIPAQAALLAMRSRDAEPYTPLPLLKYSLLSNKSNIMKLVGAATSAHRRLGEAPQVTWSSMRYIITADFDLAHDMQILPYDELVDISTRQYKWFGISEAGFNEFQHYVIGKINEERRALKIPFAA